MVAIRPFAALRYNPANDLSQVICPPYDVIDPKQQEQLYQTSPYNTVRLILGKQYPTDTAQENRYTRAQRDFEAWRKSGVLYADTTPTLYLIEHTFASEGRVRSRLGFIALLELNDQTSRSVYRHEATLAAPKEDRTRLLKAIPANLEPIFCIVPDAGRGMQCLLERVRAQEPAAVQAMLHGETIKLWTVTKPDLIDEVARQVSVSAVLIADGHHRFEVALAHRDRYGALMSYFVSMEDPGLVIRPIHRLVARDAAIEMNAVRALGTVAPASDVPALMSWLAQTDGQGRFGCSDGKALYRVTIGAGPLAQWLAKPSVATPLAALDISILHGLVLPRLGVGSAQVRYSADAAQAISTVKSDGGLAWLLRAIPLPQVYALAAQGLTLPPKSTYFYPKVPSGLTINLWEDTPISRPADRLR